LERHVARNGDDVEVGEVGREQVEAILDTSLAMTFAPSLANRMAVARPIPEPAPVTMTTCRSNRFGMNAVPM
jgi:hypothetical protein